MDDLKKSSFLVLFLFVKSIFFVLLPYVVIQAVLRVIMVVLSINHFFSSSFMLLPISFFAGFIYDVVCAMHIALCILALIIIVPYHIRVSIAGKVLSFFIIFLFSFFVLSVFFTEIFLWWTEGVRFYGNFFSYFADFFSALRHLHRSYGWYCSGFFVLLIFGTSFSLCRFVVARNIFGRYVFLGLSQIETLLCILIFGMFLFFCDLFHSRFDIVAKIRSGRTISAENRYVTEVAKNGLFESIINSFSGLWKFEDLYLSIPLEKNNVKNALLRSSIANKNTVFVDDDSDISAPQGLRLSANVSSEKRYNVIVIMMDDFNYIKNSRIEYGNIGNMPYLSMLSQKSIFFENFYAISARKHESLFALFFSVMPIKKEAKNHHGELFALPNLLRSHGYNVKSFHERFYTDSNELSVFLNAGFVAESVDNGTMGAAEIRDVAEHKKRIEFDTHPKFGHDNAERLTEEIIKYADEAYEGKEDFFYVISSPSFSLSKKTPPGTLDANIKRFFTHAKERVWFENTAFVFVGVNAGKNNTTLPINPNSHLVPFFIILPGQNSASIFPQMASSLDFATILMNILGIKYISKFQGIDPRGVDKQTSVILKSGEFFGYIRGDKMGIMAPYQRWNLYEKRFNNKISFVSMGDIGQKNDRGYFYMPLPIAGINVLELLNNENDKYTFGRCSECRYQNVSWDEQSMSWRSGKVYKKYVSKPVMVKKKALANTDELFLLEMIAVLGNNAIAQKNMKDIKYNVLFDDSEA